MSLTAPVNVVKGQWPGGGRGGGREGPGRHQSVGLSVGRVGPKTENRAAVPFWAPFPGLSQENTLKQLSTPAR